MDGTAEAVVQVGGSIHGGVHFHGGQRPSPKPQLLPAATQNYTNQVRVLAAADRAVSTPMPDADPRFVVFQGPPGIGKRQTARVWLHRRVRDFADFPDGQFHADLAASSDQQGLVSAKLHEFLSAAGYRPAEIPDSLEGRSALFRHWSTGRRVAVLLDNALTPAQVRAFAPGPGASIVVVSSAGPLASLAADKAVTFVKLSPMDEAAAHELLILLVGAERVGAEPDAVKVLVQICGGLPIALCVLGSMLMSFPTRRLSRVVAELENEQRRLRAFSRDEDLSVTAVFNTAYARVTPAAQRCYRAFGVHPGTGDVGLAVLVAALEIPEAEVRETVDSLIKADLVNEISRADSDERYEMHSLVRLHAREIAATEDPVERAAMLERIADFYFQRGVIAGHAKMPDRGWTRFLNTDLLSVQSAAGVFSGADPGAWLETERDNLRVIVELAAQLGQLERVCDLAVMLWPLHEQGKYFEAQIAVNTLGLAAAQELASRELVALIGVQLGFPYLHLGDVEQACAIFSAALSAAEQAGEPKLEATAWEALGLARLAQDRPAEALELLSKNLELAIVLGADRRLALARLHLAKVESPGKALVLLSAALEGFLGLKSPDTYNAAKTRLWLGKTFTSLGRFMEATGELEEALKVLTAHGVPFDRLLTLEALGDLAQAQNDVESSLNSYQQALAIAVDCSFTTETKRLRGKLADASESELLEHQADRGDAAADPD